MYTRKTTILNETGLHARPASEFVSLAKQFPCSIIIKNMDKENVTGTNAKSIIKVLTQGLYKGAGVEISADGEGEEEAVNRLVDLIDSGFGEI